MLYGKIVWLNKYALEIIGIQVARYVEGKVNGYIYMYRQPVLQSSLAEGTKWVSLFTASLLLYVRVRRFQPISEGTQ